MIVTDDEWDFNKLKLAPEIISKFQVLFWSNASNSVSELFDKIINLKFFFLGDFYS